MRPSGTTNSSRTAASGSCRSNDKQVSRSTVRLCGPPTPTLPHKGGGRLEVARAPGCPVGREHGIGAGNRSLLQLLDPARLHEGTKAVAAQVDGGEVGDINGEIGIGFGPPAFGVVGAALELELAVVPGTNRVADAQSQTPLGGIAPSGQRRRNIHQA